VTFLRFKMDPDPRHVAESVGLLADEFQDWRPAWVRLVPEFAKGLQEVVTSQGAALGASWAPHSSNYVPRKRRRRRRGSRRVGIATGATYRQITNAQSGLRAMTPGMVKFGPTKKKAFVFHYGHKNQPARPLIAFTPEMRLRTLYEMDRHAKDLLQQAADRIRGR